jgi:flagellar biosynthetic protein FliR
MEWISVTTVLMFLLVFSRISGLFITAPILNNQSIPIQTKLGIAVSISFIIFLLHANETFIPPHDVYQFAWMLAQEVLVGVLLGFAVTIVVAGVQMCGELISVQQGLSVSNILDPITQTNAPVMGRFYFFMALVLFLSLNIDHSLIVALNKSFEWLPLGNAFGANGLGDGQLSGHLAERFILLSSNMYVIGLMMGIPVFGALLVLEVSLAFVTKVMPQMNIFVVGLPFKVALGLLMIMVSLPASTAYLLEQYDVLVQQLMGLFQS